jgi:predicted amidohydrolase YtcJ
VANSAALALAGIDRTTADPPGGIIDRYPDGGPTGVLKESAMELVTGLIPDVTAAERVDDAPQRRTRVFCERFNPGGFDAEGAPDADLLQRCYLDGRYKYVFEREADGEGSGPVSERFYDIDADPLELVDLRATGTWTPEEQWRFATLRLEMLDLVGDGPPQPAGSAPLHHREIRLPR